MTKKRSKANAPAMDIASDDKWRAQDDLRTIERAHEIIHDKGRLTAAQSEAKRQSESLARIARLKDKPL